MPCSNVARTETFCLHGAGFLTQRTQRIFFFNLKTQDCWLFTKNFTFCLSHSSKLIIHASFKLLCVAALNYTFTLLGTVSWGICRAESWFNSLFYFASSNNFPSAFKAPKKRKQTTKLPYLFFAFFLIIFFFISRVCKFR